MDRLEVWLEKNLRPLFWILGTYAGFVQMLAHRNVIYSDGVNYLTLAQAYVEKGWSAGVNGFWSPLYSWVLIPIVTLRPVRDHELLAVHFLNFLIFLSTMLAFNFFLDSCFGLKESDDRERTFEPSLRTLVLFRGVAYLIFLCMTMDWVGNGYTTPDLLVACLSFLAAAHLLRFSMGINPGWNSAGFGAALALGYFAKTAVFPLAIVLLALLPLLATNLGKRRRTVFLAPIVFVLMVVPFVWSVSKKEGKLTFGESGRVAYVIYEGGFSGYWDGEDAGGPTQPRGFHRVATNPPVYVFDDPPVGAYLPSLEPSRWYRAIKPKFTWRNQLRALQQSSRIYGEIFTKFTEIPAALLALIYVCESTRRRLIVRHGWFLASAGIFMGLMYALVHVEERFLAGFLVILWVGLLRAALLAATTRARVTRPILIGLFLVLLAGFVFRTARLTVAAAELTTPMTPPALVASLRSKGLDRNSKIGLLGNGADLYIARVGQYSIVASIPPSFVEAYFADDAASQAEVDQAFKNAGARALIMHSPCLPPQVGWQSIPTTDLFIRFLDREPAAR
jgi:hypothetical protein